MKPDLKLSISDVIDRGIFVVGVRRNGVLQSAVCAFLEFFAAMWRVGMNRGWVPKLLVEDTLRGEGVSQHIRIGIEDSLKDRWHAE